MVKPANILPRNCSWKWISGVVLLSLVYWNEAPAQSTDYLNGPPKLVFENYDSSFGFVSSVFYDVIQDEQGFIWVASEITMARFDGNELTRYEKDLDDPNSISDDFLSDLFIDREGMIWISSFRDSLMRLDPERNVFETVQIETEISGSSPQGVQRNKMMQDSEGTLWVATVNGGGLLKVDAQTMAFTRMLPEEDGSGIFDPYVFSIVEDNRMEDNTAGERAGWLWIGYANGGVDRLNIKTGEIKPLLDLKGERVFTSGGGFNELYFDDKGQLWAGTGSGLQRFNAATRQFETVVIPGTENLDFAIQEIYPGTNNDLWLGTHNHGLMYYAPDTGIAGMYQQNINDENSIADNEIKSILIDHSGNLWLATGGALSKADLNRKPFGIINHSKDVNSLSDNKIYDLVEDKQGDIWVGTHYGLNKLDVETGKISRYFHDRAHENSLSHDKIWSLLADSGGKLWVGVQQAGVDVFDPQNQTWVNLKNKGYPELAEPQTMYALYEDDQQRVWLGSTYGLMLYDPQNESLQMVPDKESTITSVTAFIQDDFGTLWMGTSGNGLVGLDLQTLKVKYLFTHEEHGLSDDNVFSLMMDSEGLLWIGTNLGLSILKLDEQGKPADAFLKFTDRDGLVYNTVVEMLEDRAGDVWVATGSGLSHTQKKYKNGVLGLTFRNYDKKDGVASDIFYIGPSLQNDQGIMYFGGDKGITLFDPLQITDNPIEPKMAITGLALFNQPIETGANDEKGRVLLPKAMTHLDKLQLSYRDRVLTLSFAAMHYSEPAKNKYKYRLKGFQDEWMETMNVRQATYTNLPGGTYTFEVLGANLDGVWSQEPARLSIVVAPPFWQTWWFRISVGVFVVLSFAGFYYYRTQAMRKQNRILEQRVAERTEELHNKNELLEDANIELTVLNEEVNSKNNLLEDANVELMTLNEEVSAKNHLLEEANIELEVQKNELREALETNKEILGVTAHDLKNPLGGVIGLAELIIEDATELEPKQYISESVANAEMLKVEAEHMLQCIKDLLDKYRGEYTEQPRRERANLAEVLVNVVRWNQKTADDKEIALINNNKDPVPVQIDVVEIQRAMDNLISNAIKYSPAGTEVQLLLESKGEIVRFTVIDQGPGLTEEDLTKVFGKLQQLSAKPTAGEHSTGLGLFSVKELVENHNGKVGVDSVYGEGAAFWFELPVVVTAEVRVEVLS